MAKVEVKTSKSEKYQETSKSIGSEMGSEWVQNGSKMGPEWVQNGSKMGPKWVQNGSRMGPKWVHGFV